MMRVQAIRPGISFVFNTVIGALILVLIASSGVSLVGGHRGEKSMEEVKDRVSILQSTSQFAADLNRLENLMVIEDSNSIEGYETKLTAAIARFKASFDTLKIKLDGTAVANIGIPGFFGQNAADDRAVWAKATHDLKSQTTTVTAGIDSVQRSLTKVITSLKAAPEGGGQH